MYLWHHKCTYLFYIEVVKEVMIENLYVVQYSVFYEEYEKKKKNGKIFFDLPDEDLNPGPLKKFAPTI